MLVTKQIEIDLGHRLMNHKSKCSRYHGHRYKIEVGVDDKVTIKKGVSDEGMVIDFGDLKEIMMQEIDAKFDHRFIIEKGDLLSDSAFRSLGIIEVDFPPTAENLAKHWYLLIEPKLRISYVKVWETPTSTAIFTNNDK